MLNWLVSEDQSLDELSFKTQNLNARVDFTKIGEFKSNSREALLLSQKTNICIWINSIGIWITMI